MIPIDERIQLWIEFERAGGVLDKFLLNRLFASQVHVQVNHGGLDIFMSQAVFDIGNGVSATEHVHGTGVPEAVGRMDGLKPLLRQRPLQVFLAQPVDA